jgi:hypothetical protein
MLINWLLYPVLMVVASTGHGLLVRRIIGGPSNLLLIPVGFASMVVCTTMLMATRLHGVAWLGIVIPAVAGWWFGRHRIGPWRAAPSSEWLWPALCALGAFATFAAPVVLFGHLTFTGFSEITDTANHFDLTAQLVRFGRVHPSPVDSSYAESVRKLLDVDYPMGLHSLLGAWSELLGRELAWMYQPTVAFAGPVAALGAFGIFRWVGLPTPLRALAAVVVAQPNLLYAYGLAAGFKELFAATMIIVSLAVLLEGYDEPGWRLVVAAVPVAAGIDVFTVTIAPWLGVVLLVFVLATLLRAWGREPVRWAVRWVVFAATAAVLAWPLFPSISGSATAASGSGGLQQLVTSPTDLGNLAAPLDPLTSVGIWLTGDYRFPLAANVGLTHGLIYVVLVLAALGALSVLWRRRPEILAVAVAGAVVYLVVPPRTGPWVDAKVFAVTGALVLTAAFFGIAALAGSRRTTPFAWILALLVSGGVLYGNALAVHSTTLAPDARLRDLERIGHRFAGKGPALAPAFDEYAEYFLRNLKAIGRVNPPNGFPGDPPQFGTDIDEVNFSFVESFPLLVLRRNPERSRPPSNYGLVYRSRFYDVWRRDPALPVPVAHFPVGPLRADRPPAACRGVVTQLRADRHADHLVWAVTPSPQVWSPLNGTSSPNWVGDPAGQALHTHGPGHADGFVVLEHAATYELWETGSFERPVQIRLDGRLVGTLSDLADYPGEADYVATISLRMGYHAVQVRRGGGSLRPGNGDATGSRYIGPLYFKRTDDPGGTTFQTPVAQAMQVCRSSRHLDWVDLVDRPSAG